MPHELSEMPQSDLCFSVKRHSVLTASELFSRKWVIQPLWPGCDEKFGFGKDCTRKYTERASEGPHKARQERD